MSNPFLFDDDGGADVIAEPTSNPFLQEAPSNAGEYETTENPFFAQPTSAAVNPFADYQADVTEPPAATNTELFPTPKVDTAMSFFGTTINDTEEENSEFDASATYNESAQSESKKVPPPRPTPPNQATQDLISTVADHLDQTSSHLLGRLPATRTPSPVSIRDLHSPSPTPENGDLLDVSNDEFDSSAVSSNNLRNDNPFADLEEEVAPVSTQPFIEQKPQAPVVPPQPLHATPQRTAPPPRPAPPKPTPPRRPSPPAAEVANVAQSKNDTDLFDMFGNTSSTAKPKSNQDILNLFSAPKNPEQPTDLLTSDIFSMDNQPSQPKPAPPPPPPSRLVIAHEPVSLHSEVEVSPPPPPQVSGE